VPGASLLMTGSPHTSMPYAMHHFKPQPIGWGFFYVQEKVRPGTGREAGLGHERYIAIEHMDKVRPQSGREGGLGHVRRDCVSLARPKSTSHPHNEIESLVSIRRKFQNVKRPIH